MEMWTAALKWAMEFDSIVNRHNLAVAADEESAKLKPPVAHEPLIARLPAVASPITPRQFSLARDSLTIPLDDDVGLRSVSLHACCTCYVIVIALVVFRCFSSYEKSAADCKSKSRLLNRRHVAFAHSCSFATLLRAVCSSAFSTSCASRTRTP